MNFEPQFPRPNKEFNPKKEPEIFFQQNKKDVLSLVQKISSIILNILMIILFFGLVIQIKNNKNLFSNDQSNVQWALDKKVKNNILTMHDFHGFDSVKNDIKKLIQNIKEQSENIPRGFLLHGPPGTGKTYLAKCLAGSIQKHAPFFIVNGSDLVEKYVGVGALRIRSLFETAKKEANKEKKKYFFIFIDEIDSIGRKRSSDGNSANIESENTLNALLSEIDGFNSNNEPYGIVFGSTNREELLDNALIREGRLGKKIYLGHPNKKEIQQLIKFFLSKNKIKFKTINKLLEKDDQGLLNTLSSAFLTTSDINSLIKETIKLAPDKENIQIDDLYNAFDTIQMGVQNEKEQSEEDKDKIIEHELGHALVTKALGIEVNRINVESKGQIGGYTISNSKNEIILPTQSDLIERIIILLGGRAAEAIFRSNNISSGSSDDLKKARALANRMVQELGMCFKLNSDKTKIITENIISEGRQTEEINNIINNSYIIAKHIMEKYGTEEEYKQIFQELKRKLKTQNKMNKKDFNELKLNDKKCEYFKLDKNSFESILNKKTSS
ncbi:AAA family ATPase [Columbia Basin potato purple top phytoplasma]|uniref:AAA family ATPase n=1 Tax=Columbia Basin potato purple top phytoplasma TaxID=307134 RepID=A0ABT5LAL5_9MOLU|nr:AAA family ATPase [Columbia Basin potato purple top phytoplasma]MDC9031803.1 AAA family ATPase [Columbia Basin potato purple top phytoplasma]